MPILKCYRCGFETTDASRFVGCQGDGTTYWSQFICPQCLASPAKVAPLPDRWTKAPYKEPNWSIDETNYGLYIRVNHEQGGSSSAPMVADHQLAKQPASLLRKGLEGTMWDHHKRLETAGRKRLDAFSEASKDWRDANPNFDPKDYQTFMADLRSDPPFERIRHDDIQERLGSRTSY